MSNYGRTLTTLVGWMPSCEDKPYLEARESSHAITLVLKEKKHAPARPDSACSGDPRYGLASISLDHPVGDRKITDLVIGSAITPFDDAHFPYPRYLSAGYTLADNAIGLGNRVSPPDTRRTKPAWTYTYQRNPDKGGQAGAVSITAGTGETTPTQGTPISVNGHPARLQKTDLGRSRTAVWTQNGYTITVWVDDPFMTDADFLRITQSLKN